MPIYEYRCKKGHTLEVMQRMSDDALSECTTCGAPVQRVFHPIAVHFKGSGFYNTDYGTKSKNADDAKMKKKESKSKGGEDGKAKKGDSDSSSSKGKSDSSSGDSKPKASADSKSSSSPSE